MKTLKNGIASFAVAFLLIAISNVEAQGKYIDKNGKIAFEASEELFEPVKAENNSVTSILNTETGDIASLALMKSFRFKNSLMEEHFNENYIESETYPKATFKGKLIDFNFAELSETETEIIVDGKIALRGKEKEIKTTVTLKKLDNTIVMNGSFIVTPEDFDIDIPSVVKNKIAKKIIVTLDFNLEKR